MDKFHPIDTSSLFIHLNTHSFITPTNTLTSSHSSPHRLLVASRAPSPSATISDGNELIIDMNGTTHGGDVMFDLAIDDLLDFSANVELDVNVMDTCSSITDDPTCHNLLASTIATTTNFTNPSYTHINTCASTLNSTSTTTNKLPNPSTSPTSSSSSINPPIISDSINADYIINPSVSFLISDKLPFNNNHQNMGVGIGIGGGGGGVDELCVPCEDMAELEWLSNFVEESFSSCGHHHHQNANANANANPNTNIITNTNANAITHHQHDHGIAIHYNYDTSFQSTSPISVLEHTTPPTDAPPAACVFKNPRLTRPSDMPGSPAFVRLENVPLGGRAARSKRHRPNATGPDNADPAATVCFWNTRILCPEASESILESPNSSSTTTSYDQPLHHDSPNVFSYDQDGCDTNDEDEDYNDDDDDDDHKLWSKKAPTSSTLHKGKKPKKLDTRPFHTLPHVDPRVIKPKKSPKVLHEETDLSTHHGDPGQATARKCLHCATQKTPQWRAGPLGPKTLCNACGVRYKSGRLCPEYRPASSPTFIETVHSNSHRKVVEMRRQKGVPISNMNPLA